MPRHQERSRVSGKFVKTTDNFIAEVPGEERGAVRIGGPRPVLSPYDTPHDGDTDPAVFDRDAQVVRSTGVVPLQSAYDAVASASNSGEP